MASYLYIFNNSLRLNTIMHKCPSRIRISYTVLLRLFTCECITVDLNMRKYMYNCVMPELYMCIYLSMCTKFIMNTCTSIFLLRPIYTHALNTYNNLT